MTARRDEADRLWAALGDPMRIRLLDLLLERGEATASTLAAALPITRQGVSKHLAILERDGLVAPRRSGREVRYAVREERLDRARGALAQTAARWDARLAAIKELAEQAAKSGGDTGTSDLRNLA
jgi:DNA-binding transcriptional ArsR family regulator